MRSSSFLIPGLIALALGSTACPSGESPHRAMARQAEEAAKARQGPPALGSPERVKTAEPQTQEPEPPAGKKAGNQGRHHRPSRP